MKAVKNSTFDSGVLGSQVSFAVLSVARIAKKSCVSGEKSKILAQKTERELSDSIFGICCV